MDYGASVQQDTIRLSETTDTSTFQPTVEPTLFNITFEGIYGATGVDGDYSRIVMNITFTNATALDGNSSSCPGIVTRHSCILRPAVISYPITIYDTRYTDMETYEANIFLGYNTTSYGGDVWYTADDGNSQYTDDMDHDPLYDKSSQQLQGYKVLTYQNVLEDHVIFGAQPQTVIGGFVNAFNHFLAGSSSLRYSPSQGYYLDQSGSAVAAYDSVYNSNFSSGGCGFQYKDPLDYTLRRINLLMFAMATDPWWTSYTNNDRSAETTFNATQYSQSIHYKTNHGFMYGALASILFCVLCVLPSYWGYWQLGRDVTLGPFEIANAFRAPILDHPTVANAGVKELIREVGQKEVKYGAMVQTDASGRLAIAEPEAVRRVHPSIHDRSM